jgi:alkylation response protein AidB-like acyl-CoA dehydrogenase
MEGDMDVQKIADGVGEVSEQFARDRRARQLRRELDPADFDALRKAGFLLAGVPVAQGGTWESVPKSTRAVCEILRVLARGDASVALVSTMHPSVLAFWLATPQVEPEYDDAWQRQRDEVIRSAVDGAWWGTITSEPGSGGDVSRSKATAKPEPSSDGYRLSGQKHFGSGTGITSFAVTSAVPDGAEVADWFYLDMRNVVDSRGAPLDGVSGIALTAPWDGHGMTATQSHAYNFTDFPATRFAWPEHLLDLAGAAFSFIDCAFTAVIVGIVETALDAARRQLEPRHSTMRAYEQTEWSRAEMEGWLILQAYEGMLRAIESGVKADRVVVQGKTAVAELAESALMRVCRVIGGGTFSRQSPFGNWAEDVRALGFLRPPWAIAYDRMFDSSWPKEMS